MRFYLMVCLRMVMWWVGFNSGAVELLRCFVAVGLDPGCV